MWGWGGAQPFRFGKKSLDRRSRVKENLLAPKSFYSTDPIFNQ